MRAVVQRVTRAEVRVGGEVVGSIGPGLCVLVGVTHDDDERTAEKLAAKLWGLRIMAGGGDGEGNARVGVGVGDLPVSDTTGELMVISQFTLYGDTRKGRRPSYVAAARPEHAEPVIDRLVLALRSLGATVATGRFGANMQVELVNDGPVTVILEL